MDKQKQIEEMAKVIFERGIALESIDFVYKSDHFERIATTLYDAGYRKIPENAVVFIPTEEQYALLSKEEYERIKGFSREEVDEISETAMKNYVRKQLGERYDR